MVQTIILVPVTFLLFTFTCQIVCLHANKKIKSELPLQMVQGSLVTRAV